MLNRLEATVSDQSVCPASRARWISRVTLLVVFVCCVPAAHGGGLPGKWLEVRTPHFVVLTNASQKQALETAEHFEQIRALFARSFPHLGEASGPPLQVFAARDERTMKRLLPAYWESRNRARPGGVFSRGQIAPQIVIRADFVGGENFRVVYHEYFHFLVYSTGVRLPVWLNEGLADFWGSTRLTPEGAEAGRPNNRHLDVLRDRRLLPLDVLLSVDHASPHYQRINEKRLFYAQAWALVHYILLGDESGQGEARLRECLRLLTEGVESKEAAAQAFGDLNKLELELRKYARSLLFRYARLPAAPGSRSEGYRTRKVPSAEAAAWVARFLLERAREEAEELVGLAREGAPELAVTDEAVGLFHAHRSEYPEAASAFERAVHKSDAGPLAYYGHALFQFHEDRTRERLGEIEQLLLQAISKNRDFAPAFVRLAEVYRRTDEGLSRALAMLRRALAIHPEHTLYRLKEAQFLWENGDQEAAIKGAREVVSEVVGTENAGQNNAICWSGSLWGLADAVLLACDRAVELDPQNSAFHESRGVARALTGSLEGALADLRAARALARDTWSATMKSKRDAWIHSLESGVSPFVGEGFEKLRDDPEEDGLNFWL